MSDPNAPTPPTSGEEGAGRPPQDHPLRPDLPTPGTPPAPSAYPPPPPSPYPTIADPAYAPPSNPYADPVANPYYGVTQPYRGGPAGSMPEPYAHWGRRVAAYLLDTLISLPFGLVVLVGVVIIGNATSTDPITNATTIDSSQALPGFLIAGVGELAAVIFSFWNLIFRQGRRGASLGKQWMQIVVVSERDGRPIGALMTFVRQIVHVLDALACYLGFLWPLWDAKRQTFADKIMTTVVLHLPPL